MNDKQLQQMRAAIEEALAEALEGGYGTEFAGLKTMLTHHLSIPGKRLRPLLVLLTCSGYCDEWHQALPWAVQIELIHNFSLIHDDIEDNSSTRRGMPTVWQRWGVAHAINAGDSMFSLAHLAGFPDNSAIPARRQLIIARCIQQTCLDLTRGQYLDMDFEQRETVTLDEYESMIAGKTAALIACSCKAGALVGGATMLEADRMAKFGHSLGLAFQVMDDWLGIWGDEALTGKSAAGDLVSGKKSYPVIIGLEHSPEFARLYRKSGNSPELAGRLAARLAEDGVQSRTEAEINRLTDEALSHLAKSVMSEDCKSSLTEIANNYRLRRK